MTEAAIAAGRGTLPGRAEAGRLIAIVVPLALLAGAYGSQYFGGLFPCEMCWWQRYGHFAAVIFAAPAFAFAATSAPSRALVVLAAAAIAVSGGIGVYHAGVELHVFEGFTTCSTTAKAATTGELLKKLMAVPLIRCDQVQWSFLGISMAGWNAIISLPGAAAVAWLTLSGSRRR